MSASRTILVNFPEAETSRILVSYLTEEVDKQAKEVINSEEMVVAALLAPPLLLPLHPHRLACSSKHPGQSNLVCGSPSCSGVLTTKTI